MSDGYQQRGGMGGVGNVFKTYEGEGGLHEMNKSIKKEVGRSKIAKFQHTYFYC